MAVERETLVSHDATAIRHIRRLDQGGEVLLEPGAQVEPGSLIGHNSSEELLHYLRVEADESRLLAKMLKQVGDEVKRGEPVAYYMFMFGLGYREYVSPVNGTIVTFDPRAGLIGIREHPMPVHAGLAGTVDEVIPGYGVVIRTHGAMVQGTAGWGGVAWGELLLLVDMPAAEADLVQVGPGVRGKVVVTGRYADLRLMQACYRHGARALIAGGIDQLAADEFTAFTAGMTYEEYATRYYSGAALDEDAPDGTDTVRMPIIALDGLGRVPIREQAFSILARHAGRGAFVDAQDQEVLSGNAPVVIFAEPDGAATAIRSDAPAGRVSLSVVPGPLRAVVPGAIVRVVGGPHNGHSGSVREIAAEVTLETGLQSQGAVIDFAGGNQAVVPLANLEILQPVR